MKRKSIIMLASALLIVTSMAFGTIAYLTDQSGVKNNFTIGNVDIVVDETKVDENGDPIVDPDNPNENERTDEGEENTYPLIPGASYEKDPTLTVKAGSQPAYVRMVVTISHASELKEIYEELKIMYGDELNFIDWMEGYDANTWELAEEMTEDTTANTFRLEFRYPGVVDAANGAEELDPLFTKLNIPGHLSYDHVSQLNGFYVEVVGHAIQETGFGSADLAWAAFDDQLEAEAKLN